jgi:hypothetical protein
MRDPGSVASENAQDGIQHMAHLSEVVSVLNGAVDLVDAFQKPETVLAPFIGGVAFRDDIVFGFHKTACLA